MPKSPATTTANIPQQLVKQRSRWFQGISPLKRSNIGNDIITGIVLAAIGIPEVMGYTKISGTPIAECDRSLNPIVKSFIWRRSL